MTRVVEQLLEALVADGRSGLARPPPRHRPVPSFVALEHEIARAFPALAHIAYPAVLQTLYAHELPGLDCGIVRFEARHRTPLRGGRVADLAAVDPQGSAAAYYDFFDE
jgi:hypothetical protein